MSAPAWVKMPPQSVGSEPLTRVILEKTEIRMTPLSGSQHDQEDFM